MAVDTGDSSRVRTAILVLGMHRSGTSALTRVMNILGAALPERLMPKAAANPVGHFEPMEIVNIHERLLTSAGTSWADWSAFPEAWSRSNERDAYVGELEAALLADYADTDLFLVKDPRILRFVPLWLDLLARHAVRPVAVLPYRNPIEVALSLNARDGFPREHGFLLWLRHVLEAEFHSRAMPRTFVAYDRLLSDRQMMTYRLVESLPVTWPRKTAAAFEEINRFLDSKLRRNTASREDLALHADIPAQVRGVYEAYERLEDDPQDRAAMDRLDAIRAEFDTASAVMATTFRSLRERFEQERHDTNRLTETYRQETRQLHENIEGLHRKVQENLNAMDQQRQLREGLDRLHEQLRENVAVLGQQIRENVEALDRDSATLREKLEILDSEGGDAAQAIGSMQEQLRNLHTGLAHAVERDSEQSAQLETTKERTQKQANALRTVHAGVMRVRGDRDFDRYRRERNARNRWRLGRRKSSMREKRIEIVLRSGLFDSEWYATQYLKYATPGTEPIGHFVDVGSAQLLSPGPLFDAQWYIEAHPDLVGQGIEPLFHYLSSGMREGRLPLPS